VKINGLTVCVGYAEYLAIGIERWMAGLDSLTIVTTPDDQATLDLAEKFQARVLQTDLFYQDGASFNKGRALEFARRTAVPWRDWILIFDSDIVPEPNWLDRVQAARTLEGYLHGAWRFDAGQIRDLHEIDTGHFPYFSGDAIGVGYFQLFHSGDRRANEPLPVIDTFWIHGGNYDNRFMDRWRRQGLPIQKIDVRLVHVGERDNWFGKGCQEEFLAMQKERQRRRGRWDHERLDFTPDDVRAVQSRSKRLKEPKVPGV